MSFPQLVVYIYIFAFLVIFIMLLMVALTYNFHFSNKNCIEGIVFLRIHCFLQQPKCGERKLQALQRTSEI